MSYIQEIADKFLETSNARALGPADFTTIAEWEKQEIPKEVVLTSITAMSAEREIRSIADIQEGVRQYFLDWLQLNSPEHVT